MSQPPSPEVLKFHHRIPLVINFEYSLHPDRIVVTGSKTWIPRIECMLWLKTLSNNSETLWIRSAHFQWASILLACILAVSSLILPGAGSEVVPILIFVGILILPVLAYIFWSRTLIRYAQFSTLHGPTVLSVGDAGPDRERFDSFVKELTDRIHAAQATE